jgi:hypothetical protein
VLVARSALGGSDAAIPRQGFLVLVASAVTAVVIVTILIVAAVGYLIDRTG